MTGKLSAAFGAGLEPELRSDSTPHQGGQARPGCSSEGVSRQEMEGMWPRAGFVPRGSERTHSPLLIKCILLWLSLAGTQRIKSPYKREQRGKCQHREGNATLSWTEVQISPLPFNKSSALSQSTIWNTVLSDIFSVVHQNSTQTLAGQRISSGFYNWLQEFPSVSWARVQFSKKGNTFMSLV